METERKRKRAPTEVWSAVSRSTASDANGIGRNRARAMRQQIDSARGYRHTVGRGVRGPVARHATTQRWRMAHNRYGRTGAWTMEQNGGEDGQRRAEQEGWRPHAGLLGGLVRRGEPAGVRSRAKLSWCARQQDGHLFAVVACRTLFRPHRACVLSEVEIWLALGQHLL